MLQAEEFISVKLATGQRSAALRDVSSRLEVWKREWYQARISGDQDKMEEFLEWNSAFMEGLAADIRMLAKSADDERRTIGPMVDELLDGMKRVLMLPVSSLLSSFPKMVRDLARTRGKQVELSITGADIEIDKRIIENLKDPLTHILRNGVDHGIETPETRQSLGKPARGQIVIAVSQLENNKIQICVSDDGGGHRRAAPARGRRARRTAHAGPDRRHRRRRGPAPGLRLRSLDQPGGVAGLRQGSRTRHRGGEGREPGRLGGRGDARRARAPRSASSCRPLWPRPGASWPRSPTGPSSCRWSASTGWCACARADVRLVENRETIQLEGRTVPLVYMHEVLDLPLKPQRNVSDYIQAVVAGSGDDRVAFAVDRIIDEQEVLVKTLGPQLVRVRNIAGGTIIGSGKVVPIINISDLLQSASSGAARGSRADAAAARTATAPGKPCWSSRIRSPPACCSRTCWRPRATT